MTGSTKAADRAQDEALGAELSKSRLRSARSQCVVVAIAAVLIFVAAIPGKQASTVAFPNTDDGVHIGIAFDYWVGRGRTGVHPNLNAKVDYVWGADRPGTGGSATLRNAHLDAYLPFDLDYTGHSLSWFQAHHPSWIVYRCNALGRPTRDPAYYPRGVSYVNRVPLDFSNPSVRAFQAHLAQRLLRQGYDGIAVDDFTFTNFEQRCGVYQDGKWTYLGYPQAADESNGKLTSDMLGWLRYLRRTLKRSNPGATLTVNFSVLASGQAALREILPYVDGVLDEVGFTRTGTGRLTGAQWQAEVNEAELLRAKGKAFVAVAYTPGPYDLPGLQEDEVNWALANYLLVKGAQTYTYVQDLTAGYDDLPEYHVPIGRPISARYQWQGVQARRYSGGLVLVNPSPEEHVYINLTRVFRNMYGRPLAHIVLAPASGIVLLDR